MITLSDGVTTLTLSPHLLWPGRTSTPAAVGQEVRTLGGRMVVSRMQVSAGRRIILQAVVDGSQLRGRWLWREARQFQTWAESGTTLTLSYHGETHIVVIPLDGIAIEAYFPKTDQPDESLCSGSLTLIEV